MYTAFLSEYTTKIPPLPFLYPESHIQGGIASHHVATAEPLPLILHPPTEGRNPRSTTRAHNPVTLQ